MTVHALMAEQFALPSSHPPNSPRPARYGRGVTELQPGDAAPDFSLLDDTGSLVSLRSYRGRRVVVYFYPEAMTTGCTTEACDFRDALSQLNGVGVDVLAISPDPPEKLATFRAKESLTFPLLSDPDRAALTAYGAWGEKTLYGRTTVGVLRSTFVVDPTGHIERAYYRVKATGHVARLLRDLGLQPV
jgi:peroxiredoxin Q/BCP